MLRVLGWIASINVRKVLWTCREIGLAFQHEPGDPGNKSHKTPEFLALNPNGLVPVIVDENGVLWESNVICRYLAMKHGRDDLLPANARQRALVEQWMDWQSTALSVWRYAFLGLARKMPGFDDPAQIEKSTADWNAAMMILERQLAGTGAYVTGDTFTLADIVLGLSVNRWLMTPIERPQAPAVSAYYERLKTRAAFQDLGPNGIA